MKQNEEEQQSEPLSYADESSSTNATASKPRTTLTAMVEKEFLKLDRVERSVLSKVASVSNSAVKFSMTVNCSHNTNFTSSTCSRGIERLDYQQQQRLHCDIIARDTTRCQRRIKELIGKYEVKNEELEKRENHLYRRVQILECSVPAVTMWKAWKTQDGLSNFVELRKFMEDTATRSSCRMTSSQHYDCRVREIEAKKKEANRRVEEARCLWLEREAALQNQRMQILRARQQQETCKVRIQQLIAETRKLEKKSRTSIAGSNYIGNKKSLAPVDSVTSLRTCDLEYFGQLESLAKAESSTKRRIIELKAKEEAFISALAQVDELAQLQFVNKVDNGDNVGKKDTSDAILRQFDETRGHLEDFRVELARYQEVKKSEVGIEVLTDLLCKSNIDVGVKAETEMKHTPDFKSKVELQENFTQAHVITNSKMVETSFEMAKKGMGEVTEFEHRCVGSHYTENFKSIMVKPDIYDKMIQTKVKSTEKYEDMSTDTCDIIFADTFNICGYCLPNLNCNNAVNFLNGIMDGSNNTIIKQSIDIRSQDSVMKARVKVFDKAIQHKPRRNVSCQYNTLDTMMKFQYSEIINYKNMNSDMKKKTLGTYVFEKLKHTFTATLGSDSDAPTIEDANVKNILKKEQPKEALSLITVIILLVLI